MLRGGHEPFFLGGWAETREGWALSSVLIATPTRVRGTLPQARLGNSPQGLETIAAKQVKRSACEVQGMRTSSLRLNSTRAC